jgi:hypothetical protein
MPYPVWNEMKPEEKFEFLHEWLMNVERAIKEPLQKPVAVIV